MTIEELPIPTSPEVGEEIERLRYFARYFGAYHSALAKDVPVQETVTTLRSELSALASSLLSQLSEGKPVLLEDIALLIEPRDSD